VSPRDEACLADRTEARAYADLYAAAPAALRDRLGLRVDQQAGVTALLAPGLPTSLFNRVIGLGLDAPATAADVERLRALYRGAGVGGWWLHWSPVALPADGADWLAASGFVTPARRSWAKMLRETADAPAVVSTLQVVLATAAQVADSARCIAQAFGMPGFMADWLMALADRPAWRLYAISDGAQVVGGACLFIDGPAAWLGMGAVLAGQRQRGGQRAAMARRIAEADAAGCRWVVTETGEPMGDESNPSLANMRHCGFRKVASRLNFVASG